MIEKTISRKDIFKGKIIELHIDEVLFSNRQKTTREVIEHKIETCIAAVTSENEVLFVKQFCYPFKEIFLELPARKLDGDEPIECAKRELLEKAGAIGHHFVSLGQIYPAVAFNTAIYHLFACEVSGFTQPQFDDGKVVELVKIPLDKAVRMVLDGEICDAKTQIGILKLKELQNKNKTMIYHIAKKKDWLEAQENKLYGDFSIKKDGFIHCSTLEQLVGVANNNLKKLTDKLVVLSIDTKLLKPEIKWEKNIRNSIIFPHIYGLINTDSVVNIVDFKKNENGDFVMPNNLERATKTSMN